jgi:hypothetical protein
MSIAPHTGIVDFGTFTAPTASTDGIQGEVPQPLAGQEGYVLTGTGWASAGSVGLVGYQGTWNASTNTPTLTSSVGVQGYYYVVDVAGTTNLNGITDWQVGDWAIFNGSIWQKVDNTDSYDPANVAITGGTINNTVIGGTTPAAGTFTTLTAQTEVLKGTGQNLIVYSNTFNNTTGWNNVLSLPLTTGQTDPFGGSTATLLSYNTQYQALVERLYTCIAGVTYTASIWVRVASGTRNFLIASNNIGTTYGTITATTTWTRYSVTFTPSVNDLIVYVSDANTSGFVNTFIYGAQLEIGSTANTYIPTTTTAVYGTPTLSFSGVSTIGLESNGSLFVQPAGTGALQAQATTSSATGGNARGANAVDWQTNRGSAGQVASGQYSAIVGGSSNTANNSFAFVGSGALNSASGFSSFVGGGRSNTVGGTPDYGTIVAGLSNTSAGFFNFVGGGFTNSGTSGSAVTTQSGTMNATTAVTLSGSNANIKVGQLITGTSIAGYTYVAAISGTSLTLSQAASGSSTSTLSFYTPHGVVVGGGNNQATGSYSFIGGGGDAGTASNRNVASGDWSVVGGGFVTKATGKWSTAGGGIGNTASGEGSVVVGGGSYGGGGSGNTASSTSSFVGAGYGNTANGYCSTVVGGTGNVASNNFSFVGGGGGNSANTAGTAILGGYSGTTRSIEGMQAIPACTQPINSIQGTTQAALLVLGVQTTDATATILRSNTSAASGTNQIILPNNSAYYFKGSVIANVTGAANGASWSFEGAIMRGANAASTVLIGTPAINRVASTSGASAWTIALTADTTNGGLAVTVTGAAATTIRWVCKAETTEVTF